MSGVDVAFVVRQSRAQETSPFVIEQENRGRRRDVLEHPTRVVDIPPHTDLILLAVRFDQLLDDTSDPLLPKLEAANHVPVVVLTPMLPQERERLADAIGRPTIAALPSVAAHIDERDRVLYWSLGLVPTVIDADIEDSAAAATVEEFAKRLSAAGMTTTRESAVALKNAATTITFFPFISGICAAGGVRELIADRALLELVLAAIGETASVARHVGEPVPIIGLASKLMRPGLLRVSIAALNATLPGLLHFLDEHFGPKLIHQHRAMGASVLKLAREHDQEMTSLEALLARLG